MAPPRDAAGPRRSVESAAVDPPVAGFRLDCPDCDFSSVVTGGWHGALDVAEEHAADCSLLPAGSVVTVQRIAEERRGQVAGLDA